MAPTMAPTMLSISTLSDANSKSSKSNMLVSAVAVRALSVLRGVWTSVQAVAGGRIPDIEVKYSELITDALADIKKQATDKGATSIVGIRFNISELSRGDAGGYLVCHCYGTAIIGTATAAATAAAITTTGGAKKRTTTKKKKKNRSP
jgi:uncharacterized protein YbjQ (UPF0145 family)